MKIHKKNVSTIMNIFEDNLNYLEDFKEFNKQLEKDTKSTGDVQRRSTNAKAYMTHWQMANKFNSYNKLLKIICTEKIPKYQDIKLIQNGEVFFSCKDMWGVIYKKNDETKKHRHLSIFSFTYYVKASENCAPIIFSDPGYLEIQPKTGTLLIWKGEYEHYVPKQKTNSPRIVISGNINC